MQPIRLRFAGTLPGFTQAFTDLRHALDAENPMPSARLRFHVELVFEEIVGNILRYGSPEGRELQIEAQVQRVSEGILLTVEDDGIAFDPCRSANRMRPDALREERDGGYGLVIVRKIASAMHYERIDGIESERNRLTVALSTAG